MKRKISVGEIIRYLYYMEQEILGRKPSYKYLEDGNRIHRRLGFYQEKYLFSRFVDVDNEWWLITGVPDEVNEEEGYIGELKTYRHKKKKDFLKEVGKTQANIYCFLSGFHKYKVYLYSVPDGKITYEEEYIADYRKARRDIRKAVRKKKKIYRIIKK